MCALVLYTCTVYFISTYASGPWLVHGNPRALLKGNGTLYPAQHPGDPSYEAVQKSLEAFDQTVKGAPELYGEVKRAKLTKDGDIAPPGSADLVVTFRNVHSWMGSATENEAFAAMFRALKPGGVLGVVQHRGDPKVKQDPKAGTGYVNRGLRDRAGQEGGI